MDIRYIILGIAALVIVIILIATITIYNIASKKRLRVENAYSQIKIQCKKKSDLVPYLADVVKSYTKKSADGLSGASQNADLNDLKNLINEGFQTNFKLNNIFLEAEQNPKIKSDVNFLQMQTELVKLEKAIAVSCGFYNDAVMMYNRTVKTFPANMIAKLFKLKAAEFLDPAELQSFGGIKGASCPSCGAVSSTPVCPHCGTRIPLM